MSNKLHENGNVPLKSLPQIQLFSPCQISTETIVNKTKEIELQIFLLISREELGMSKAYVEDTSIAGRRAEIDIKVGRIKRLLETEGLDALYLARQANFAWITAGGSGVVTMCTEDSVATVLITKDGRRYVFVDAVEAPRMKEELLMEDLGFEILTQQWFENRKEDYMKKIVGSLDKIGSDVSFSDTKMIRDRINPLRC